MSEATIGPAGSGPPEHRARVSPADRGDATLARQISLAKALPDYWQRFEACRLELASQRV